LAQRIAGEDRVAADVVDLVLAGYGRPVESSQDHVGGGARRRRQVRSQGCKEAVKAAGVGVSPDDLACVVDAECLGAVGARGGQGIIESDVEAAAVDEAMLMAGAVRIKPDDLTCVVDAGGTGIGARGIVEGSPGAAVSRAVEKAVALVAR